MITLTAQIINRRMDELLENLRPDQYQVSATSDKQHYPIQTLDTVWNQAKIAGHGGKRLRALLLWDLYQAIRDERGGSDQAAIDLGCSIEIYQTSALVHDDIIDDSPLRRGAPSAHTALSSEYPLRQGSGQSNRTAPNTTRGMGLGILLGDILSSASTLMATQAVQSLAGSKYINQAFADMQMAVETGQILDMGMESMPLDNPDLVRQEAFRTMIWKTASYTTMAPICLGLMTGGLDPEPSKTIAHDLGQPLGILYQLRDDLTDVIGQTIHTGKPVGGDILEGKRTVLLADTLSLASPKERDRLIDLYSSPERSQNDLTWICNLMRTSGAIRQSQLRIDNLSQSVNREIIKMGHRLGLNTARVSSITQSCRRFMSDAPTAGYHEHIS